MKILLVALFISIVLGFTACSKGVDTSEKDYYRANAASDKAQEGLNKE